MAKKKKARKKTAQAARTTAKAKPSAQIEADTNFDVLTGKYSNHVQVSVQQEEFVLDFFSRMGEHANLHSRIYMTPEHAERLMDLLKRQIATHKKNFKSKARKR